MSTTTTIKAGESAKTVTLPEGKALVLTGAPGTSGVAYLLDQALGGTNSLRSWTVGAGALAAIGPYENTQKIHLTCSAGSIAATVKEAVLTISATPTPTAPGQPAKPVLTAMAGAVSLAWTPGAAGSTATTSNIWTDINGNVTQLTTNPQTIAAPAGTPYTGTVTTLNAQGAGPASVQADAVTPTAVPSAVPFDSTVAFDSGQQVIYAGGLYTFTAAHPAGNWTGNDVTYNSQNGSVPRNTVGMNKPFGVVGNWSNGSVVSTATSVPATSRGMKLQMEAPFTRLKVHLYQRDANPTRGLAMSVASTETDATGSLSNGIDPIVGGTAYSVLRANSQYGFDRLKWGGLDRSPVQAPGSISPPGQNYLTGLSTAESDWSNTASVPPAVAGKLPMIVTRWNRIANAGDSSSNIIVGAMTGSYNAYIAGDPLARLYYCPSVGAGDHVTNPALSKSGATAYNPVTEGIWTNMAFAAEHGVSTRNFYAFGDSITEGYRWWQDAVRTLTTQAAPCYVVNFGCSTNRAAQYWALLDAVLRRENWATDILLPSFSPNEVQSMTDSLADEFIAGLTLRIADVAAFGKRLYIWTSPAAKMTRYSANPTAVAAINKINNWVRTEAAKQGATFRLVDIDAGYDNATMTLGGGDNVHPNASGIAYKTSVLLPVIQNGAY